MMFNIDRYAYSSKLKEIDPMEKLVFALLTMGVCLWADSVAVSVCVLLIMAWLSVRFGRIPGSVFAKLMLLPGAFLVTGVITVAFGVSSSSADFLIGFSAGGMHVGILKAGAGQAVHLFFRALGATSCLYFLSLSTPVVDLVSALKRLKCPQLLLELMSLIYRFIFVLIETADTMYLAQSARLGYSRLGSGYRSLGALASTLFIRAYKRSDELYTALESRGYDGDLRVLEEPVQKSRFRYGLAAGFNGALIAAVLIARHYYGGIY